MAKKEVIKRIERELGTYFHNYSILALHDTAIKIEIKFSLIIIVLSFSYPYGELVKTIRVLGTSDPTLEYFNEIIKEINLFIMAIES